MVKALKLYSNYLEKLIDLSHHDKHKSVLQNELYEKLASLDMTELNAKDPDSKKTLLHEAVIASDTALVRYLLNRKDLNQTEEQKTEVNAKDKKIDSSLEDKPAGINVKDKKTDATLDYKPAAVNTKDIKAKTMPEDKKGDTTEAKKADLKANFKTVNTDAKDKYDHTPLYYALNGHFSINVDIVSALKNAGCDIEDPDSNGETHLQTAIYSGNIDKIELLLAMGANVHAVTNPPGGKSILENTCEYKLLDEEKRLIILKLLFQYGVGIGLDFDTVNLPEGVVDNMVVLAAQKNCQYVKAKTPGFENAISSLATFLDLVKKGAKFNFRGLYINTTKVVSNEENIRAFSNEETISDAVMRKELKMFLVELRQRAPSTTVSLKELSVFYVAKNFSLFKQRPSFSKLPLDLQQYIEKLDKEINPAIVQKKS